MRPTLQTLPPGGISAREIHADPPAGTPQHAVPYTVEALGDSYVLLTFTAASTEDGWRQTHSVCRVLDRIGYDAIVSTYPAYDTVLLEFDPLRIDSAGITQIVAGVVAGYSAADEEWLREATVFRLPVVFGEDVIEVADELGLTVGELVDLEAAEPIRIRCRGVGSSFMMLNHDTVPSVRRLPSPVIRDQSSGDFNVAGRQCSIGFAVGRATTGWRRIGRTPVDLGQFLTPSRDYNVGDAVRLEPISSDAWSQHAGRPVQAVEAAS